MEVNVFGLARMIQLVVPSMRKNQFGKIVNVSSMGGKIWTKFGGWYHATKFAVEGLSDCLRLELEPFGIDVIVVEPGGIKTDWGIIAAENLKKVSANGSYSQAANKAAVGMIKNYTGNQLSKPKLIARTIAKAVTVKRPKTRYLVGFMAKPMVFMKNVFGDRAYDRIIKMFS
jgi:NAD(P)-dependent dehydrogenase (short-subunit alcohol dehydrogenase family)